ncbi:MAG TPA: hypothetical protein VJR23_02585 [Candidatus Acidoferrales bacterium]|nr:hypothetical protein [Candidatus Acidoferrales bacterium]
MILPMLSDSVRGWSFRAGAAGITTSFDFDEAFDEVEDDFFAGALGFERFFTTRASENSEFSF